MNICKCNFLKFLTGINAIRLLVVVSFLFYLICAGLVFFIFNTKLNDFIKLSGAMFPYFTAVLGAAAFGNMIKEATKRLKK